MGSDFDTWDSLHDKVSSNCSLIVANVLLSGRKVRLKRRLPEEELSV